MQRPKRIIPIFPAPGMARLAAYVLCACAMAGPAGADDSTSLKPAKASAQAGYVGALRACTPLDANAKDVCILEAKGMRDKVLAQAEAARKGTPEAWLDAREVAIEADYKVAAERCADRSSNDKDFCVEQAKAVRDKAEAELKAARPASPLRLLPSAQKGPT